MVSQMEFFLPYSTALALRNFFSFLADFTRLAKRKATAEKKRMTIVIINVRLRQYDRQYVLPPLLLLPNTPIFPKASRACLQNTILRKPQFRFAAKEIRLYRAPAILKSYSQSYNPLPR